MDKQEMEEVKETEMDMQDVTDSMHSLEEYNSLGLLPELKVIKYNNMYYGFKAEDLTEEDKIDEDKYVALFDSKEEMEAWILGVVQGQGMLKDVKTEGKSERIPTSELPDFCYSYNESTGEVIIIKKGEMGYYPSKVDLSNLPEEDKETWVQDYIKEQNAILDVTPEQERQMKINSMFGWDKEEESKLQEDIARDSYAEQVLDKIIKTSSSDYNLEDVKMKRTPQGNWHIMTTEGNDIVTVGGSMWNDEELEDLRENGYIEEDI